MILSAVWGGAFTLNKLALNFYSPEFIVFARLIIGTLILFLLLMLIYRRITISLKDWQYYLFMSTVGIVAPFILACSTIVHNVIVYLPPFYLLNWTLNSEFLSGMLS